MIQDRDDSQCKSDSAHRPRAGKKPIYGKATNKRILALLDKPPPRGYGRWTGPLLAKALADVDVQSGASCASTILILPAASRGARATTPSSRRKPPMWSAFMSIRPPRPLFSVSTTTLFAALEVATERMKIVDDDVKLAIREGVNTHKKNESLRKAFDPGFGAHSKRRRRVEFLGFLNSVVAGLIGFLDFRILVASRAVRNEITIQKTGTDVALDHAPWLRARRSAACDGQRRSNDSAQGAPCGSAHRARSRPLPTRQRDRSCTPRCSD